MVLASRTHSSTQYTPRTAAIIYIGFIQNISTTTTLHRRTLSLPQHRDIERLSEFVDMSNTFQYSPSWKGGRKEDRKRRTGTVITFFLRYKKNDPVYFIIRTVITIFKKHILSDTNMCLKVVFLSIGANSLVTSILS